MTTSMFQILVVEDDAELRSVLRTMLESNEYRVVEAATGERGLIEASSHRPDLIITDLGLPDVDGATLIGQIRAFSTVPILVLSARTMETEKILALDAGADDYVTKPFSAPELLARVRATLRRIVRGNDSAPLLQIGSITVDLAARTALGPDGEIHLTPLEHRVLECLARRPGMIVTQKQLISDAWGPGRLGDTRGLRSYIKTLRQKLEPDPSRPRYLITEAGIGYRLKPDESTAEEVPASPPGKPKLS
jgi:two-component system KDP operon response regulator KdpE